MVSGHRAILGIFEYPDADSVFSRPLCPSRPSSPSPWRRQRATNRCDDVLLLTNGAILSCCRHKNFRTELYEQWQRKLRPLDNDPCVLIKNTATPKSTFWTSWQSYKRDGKMTLPTAMRSTSFHVLRHLLLRHLVAFGHLSASTWKNRCKMIRLSGAKSTLNTYQELKGDQVTVFGQDVLDETSA